ncbi:MAG TPA: DnaA/Hda family protein [Phycisphaerales bacterium]|nr:DnaA/Hda family protein [Phycisphaerales bacterium]HMP37902.1 DnaA/Hda family protein [Phycisphaerales bacterium]
MTLPQRPTDRTVRSTNGRRRHGVDAEASPEERGSRANGIGSAAEHPEQLAAPRDALMDQGGDEPARGLLFAPAPLAEPHRTVTPDAPERTERSDAPRRRSRHGRLETPAQPAGRGEPATLGGGAGDRSPDEPAAGARPTERRPEEQPPPPSQPHEFAGPTDLTELMDSGDLIGAVRARVGQRAATWWFGDDVAIVAEGTTLVVESATEFLRQSRDRRFRAELETVARAALGPDATVLHRVAAPRRRAAAQQRPSAPDGDPAAPPADPDAVAEHSFGIVSALPDASLPTTGPRLEDFVAGRSNQMAFDAAVRMAQPDRGSRTLFIHGACGVGKTHLLRGIVARRLEASTRLPVAARLPVLYTTGEQFTNAFITALRTGKIDEFRSWIRSHGLLAIDDVHFLAEKRQTSSEFLHTIDHIGLDGSQVVLASDAPLDRIRAFSQALISRLKAGVVVQIDLPDAPLRAALLDRSLARRGVRLSPAARARFVACVVGTAREIEGALHRVELQWRLARGESAPQEGRDGAAALAGAPSGATEPAEIGVEIVDEALRDLAPERSEPVRPATIVSTVCTLLGIERQEFLGSSRHPRTVLARGLVTWLCRELTAMSYPEIAALVGRRNHSTVHAADRRMRDAIAANAPVPDIASLGTLGAADLAEHARRLVRRGAA